MSDGPSYVMPENVSRTLGRDAQRNNILAAKVIADIVKTTLGPKGMDKMLVDSSGNIIVTNDGVTILQEMEIEHPIAKMIVEIAKTQESEVGDGTTTAALLAGKLLENAEKLLDRKIHPTVIVKGYRIATEKAMEILKSQSVKISDESVLKSIARTAMTGKSAEGSKDKLSDIIIGAVKNVGEGKNISMEDIKIEKLKGGSIGESELIQGVVLDRERANAEMPKTIKSAKILLLDIPLEIKNPETETRISVSTPEQLASFVASEEKYLASISNKIITSGANVVFCQKGIDDVAQYYLARAGIFACRRINRSDMEKLARATSAKIISNLDDLKSDYLGSAELVEEVKQGEEALTYVRGCKNPHAVTILLRGGTPHVLDETERAIRDGLGDIIAALKNGTIVAGGGAIETEISRQILSYARTLGGREQLAVQEFAYSLESIPETLAENAGLDPLYIITELKKAHESGKSTFGLNLFTDSLDDTLQAGIVEPTKVKSQAISAASEAATMILRIDDVLISKAQKKTDENQYNGME